MEQVLALQIFDLFHEFEVAVADAAGIFFLLLLFVNFIGYSVDLCVSESSQIGLILPLRSCANLVEEYLIESSKMRGSDTPHRNRLEIHIHHSAVQPLHINSIARDGRE